MAEVPKISMDQLVKGRVYKIRSRNLSRGVWNGKDGFIGIREKFGNRYLATEYHYDTGPPFGTVYSQEDTEIDVPAGIFINETGKYSTVDQNGRGLIKDETLENPMGWDWPGWYRYADTNEVCPKYPELKYYGAHNDALFEFLKTTEEST